MRSRTANWFETTVRYERQTEDAGQKKVNEIYVVDALTFGEAEETITKEMEPFVTGEFEVKNISPASYGEIFFSDSDTDDRWYKAKLSFITIDEKTAKEKRSAVNFLVQAATFNAAVKNIEDAMGKTAIDYIIANISETKIMDVFEHNAPAKKEEKNDKPEFEGSDQLRVENLELKVSLGYGNNRHCTPFGRSQEQPAARCKAGCCEQVSSV